MSQSLALGGLLAVSLIAAGALALALLVSKKRNAVLGQRVERDAMELERLQRSFARFAPAALVEKIVSDDQRPIGERREVTVMFADIRGFTRLSEQLDPAMLVDVLNGYFREMSRVIRSHHGHITRLMGDGIMSVFGALEPNPWHVQDAVEAAIDMRTALASYNQRLRNRALPALEFGVGIHSGPVVAGLVGSDELVEYTVMGDVVNVASRVEALTRQLRTDVLVTDEVRAQLGDRFRMEKMPELAIKGKSLPIVTWAIDPPGPPQPAAVFD
jgi:adenylate cyclase